MTNLLSLFRNAIPSRGMLRVWIYGSTVAAIVAAVAGYSLYASAKEVAFAAGNQLADLGDLTGEAEAIWLNGERFHHAVVTADLSIPEVLDRFETHCAQNPNFIGRALLEIPSEALEKLNMPLSETFRHGVIRDERDGAGMVVCFVDERPSGLGELTGRLENYLKTGNLSEFGRVRYAHARQTPSGKTQVMTLWADGDLNVSRMFPAGGDAAGHDPKVLPRPPRTRRTLSATAESMPYGVFVYEATSSNEGTETRRFYDDWAKQQGWQTVEGRAGAARGYVRADGFQAFLAVSEHRGRTHISVIEAGDPRRGSNVTVRAELAE